MKPYQAFKFADEYKNESQDDRFKRLKLEFDAKIQARINALNLELEHKKQSDEWKKLPDWQVIMFENLQKQTQEVLRYLPNAMARLEGSKTFIAKSKSDDIIELLARLNVALEDPTNKENNEQLQILVEDHSKNNAHWYALYLLLDILLYVGVLVSIITLTPATTPVWIVAVTITALVLTVLSASVANVTNLIFDLGMQDTKDRIESTKQGEGQDVTFFKLKSARSEGTDAAPLPDQQPKQ